MDKLDKFRGCLLGGASDDALGYLIEFMSLKAIKARYGNRGLISLILDEASNKALISDDTQQTSIFTAGGNYVVSEKVKKLELYLNKKI